MSQTDSLGTPKWTTDRPRRNGQIPDLRQRVMDDGGRQLLEDIAERQRKLSSTSAWSIHSRSVRDRSRGYLVARALADMGLIEILGAELCVTGTKSEAYRLTRAGWDLVGRCPLHLVVA